VRGNVKGRTLSSPALSQVRAPELRAAVRTKLELCGVVEELEVFRDLAGALENPGIQVM